MDVMILLLWTMSVPVVTAGGESEDMNFKELERAFLQTMDDCSGTTVCCD